MEHLECVHDFCGNETQQAPGVSADVFLEEGKRLLRLNGDWAWYDKRITPEHVAYFWFDVDRVTNDELFAIFELGSTEIADFIVGLEVALSLDPKWKEKIPVVKFY